jgi:serine O-acetyltransferase
VVLESLLPDAPEAGGPTLGELVRADLAAATQNPRFLEHDGFAYWIRALGKVAVSPNIRVVIWYRLAHRLVYQPRWVWLAMLIRNHGIKISGAEINPYAHIGPGLHLAHGHGVGIGSHVRIGRDCTLHLGSVLGPQPIAAYETPLPTVLGDDVIVGTHAVIPGGITVGDGAVVGANVVVMRDVVERAVVSTSPGRVVGQRVVEGDEPPEAPETTGEAPAQVDSAPADQ